MSSRPPEDSSAASLAEPNPTTTARLDLGSASRAAICESQSAATAPVRIGRYEVLEVIGSGSNGTVYRAYDRCCAY